MIVSLVNYLSQLQLAKDFRKESMIFDLGPENKSLFLVNLRKYHIYMLLTSIVFMSINMGGLLKTIL